MKKVLGIALLGSLLLTGMAFSNLTRDRGVSSDRELKVGCPFATLLGGASQGRVCPVTGARERAVLPYHQGMVDGLLVVHTSQQEIKAQSFSGVPGEEHSARGCPRGGLKAASALSCPMKGDATAVSGDVCPMMGHQTASR